MGVMVVIEGCMSIILFVVVVWISYILYEKGYWKYELCG